MFVLRYDPSIKEIIWGPLLFKNEMMFIEAISFCNKFWWLVYYLNIQDGC